MGHMGRHLHCTRISPKSQLAGTPRPASNLLLALAHPGCLSPPYTVLLLLRFLALSLTLWLHSTTVQISAWSHSLMRRCRSLALSPAWKHGQGNARTKKGMCKVHFQQLVSNNNSNKLESFAKAVPWAPHLILCVHDVQMCADQSCQALTGTP